LVVLLGACAPVGPPPVAPTEVAVAPVTSGKVIEAEDRSVLRRTRGAEGAPVEVEWHGRWWPAVVVEQIGERFLVHYEGYGDNWDEVVTGDRIRDRRQPDVDDDDDMLPDPGSRP
jgi:hypothetical protein